MNLTDQVRTIGDRVEELSEQLQTEEATKNALIMPFIKALGYDVFDPAEVVPEFTADIGIKKGEKIDYAVMISGSPAILVECKMCNAKLDAHNSQLFRYFATVNARVGVLTNGVIYRFYSDLRAPNRMDEHPFFEFDITNVSDRSIELLKRVSKGNFDIEELVRFAKNLQYRTKIKSAFRAELDDPGDAFVRTIIDPVFDGRLTQNVMDRFRPMVSQAIREVISDMVEKRLQDALGKNRGEEAPDDTHDEVDTERSEDEEKEAVVTTVEELEGFFAIKSILRDLVDVNRVTARDVRSYFGVLLDDNNRKPICRLWFNRAQKYLGVFDAEKEETRIPIDGPDDLYDHAEQIRKSLQHVLD